MGQLIDIKPIWQQGIHPGIVTYLSFIPLTGKWMGHEKDLE